MIKWLDTTNRISNTEDESTWERSNSIKDLGIITHSSAFRRLAHKTQVYINPDHDYVRTRLSHSLEASQISRELARFFCNTISLDWEREEKIELESIASNACLLHDIGHPPFGHVGEEILRETLWPDFEANKQNLRIIFGLGGFEEKILKISRPLADSIIKYKKPFSEKTGKGPCYPSEENVVNENSRIVGTYEWRHPACYLMEAADDIAYICGDIEDALKLEVSDDRLEDLFENLQKYLPDLKDICDYRKTPSKFTTVTMPYLVSRAKETIKKLANEKDLSKAALPEKMYEFLRNGNGFNLLYWDGSDGKYLENLKVDLYKTHLLKTPAICSERIAARNVLVDLVKIYEPLTTKNLQQILESNLFNTLPSHVLAYIRQKNTLDDEEKLHLLRDFISGMTDRYAIHLWKSLKGFQN